MTAASRCEPDAGSADENAGPRMWTCGSPPPGSARCRRLGRSMGGAPQGPQAPDPRLPASLKRFVGIGGRTASRNDTRTRGAGGRGAGARGAGGRGAGARSAGGRGAGGRGQRHHCQRECVHERNARASTPARLRVPKTQKKLTGSSRRVDAVNRRAKPHNVTRLCSASRRGCSSAWSTATTRS